MTYQRGCRRYLDGGTGARAERRSPDEIDWFLHGSTRAFSLPMCICYDRLALFDRESAGPARHVRLGHPLAHGRFRPVRTARAGEQLLLDPTRAPDGDQDPRRGARSGWRGR
ncbi:MAG: hypothetical protein ACLR4Z_11130 [Butyricicoccaceae bacterium]